MLQTVLFNFTIGLLVEIIITILPSCILGLFFFFFSPATAHHYYAAPGRKQLSEAFGEQYISCRLIQNTFAASSITNTLIQSTLIQNTLAASSDLHHYLGCYQVEKARQLQPWSLHQDDVKLSPWCDTRRDFVLIHMITNTHSFLYVMCVTSPAMWGAKDHTDLILQIGKMRNQSFWQFLSISYIYSSSVYLWIVGWLSTTFRV